MKPERHDPAVLVAREVAAIIGVDVDTFSAWVAAGEFPVPALPLPGWRRWSRRAVERWLEANGQVAS